jgi:hypothetical protein
MAPEGDHNPLKDTENSKETRKKNNPKPPKKP